MSKRHRFPRRSFGPFTESNVLNTGLRGIHSRGLDGYGKYFESVSGINPQNRVSVSRSGVRRVKPSPLTPTAFTFDRYNSSSEGYTRKDPPSGYWTESRGALHQVYALDPVELSEPGLQSRAEVAALLKLKSQSVNFGVAFAERARTAQLVGDSALAILNSALAFRRGNIRQAWSVLERAYARGNLRKELRRRGNTAGKSITQQWLALQYGWKPLMMDIDGSCKALAERELMAFQTRVASRKGWKRTTGRNFVGGSLFNFSEITKSELSYNVALNYTPAESLVRGYTSLGLTNPAEILWELVPFSFVADWFVPVGSWLSSLDAANGWIFSSGSLTKRSICKRSTVLVPGPGAGSFYATMTSGNLRFESEKKVVRRTVYASSPIPRFPGLKDPRSMGHMANAMALLVGFFSGGQLGKLSRL